MTIEWTDAYKIGIPRLDGDHQKLVEAVNLFISQVRSDARKATLLATLKRIIALMDQHFVWEESELDRCDYADRFTHAALHHQEVLDLQGFAETFKKGALTPEQAGEHAERIEQFLVKHIVEDDFPFKAVLRTLT